MFICVFKTFLLKVLIHYTYRNFLTLNKLLVDFHFKNMDKKVPKIDSIWDDDTRMSVLFSPFREKSLNPSSWEQKMAFWVQAILDKCIQSDTCIIDSESLQSSFCRNGKVPLCLDVVLEEMQRYTLQIILMVSKLYCGITKCRFCLKSLWI